MLVTQPQGKIIERIVRTKTGVFVLATFFVFQVEGEFQVKLLSIKPVSENAFGSNKTVALPVSRKKSPAVLSYRHNYHSVASPFFNIFEFFVSQPTRAPSESLRLLGARF